MTQQLDAQPQPQLDDLVITPEAQIFVPQNKMTVQLDVHSSQSKTKATRGRGRGRGQARGGVKNKLVSSRRTSKSSQAEVIESILMVHQITPQRSLPSASPSPLPPSPPPPPPPSLQTPLPTTRDQNSA